MFDTISELHLKKWASKLEPFLQGRCGHSDIFHVSDVICSKNKNRLVKTEDSPNRSEIKRGKKTEYSSNISDVILDGNLKFYDQRKVNVERPCNQVRQ